VDGELWGTAVACEPDEVEPGPNPPYHCDPSAISPYTETPPQEPCPLGALQAIADGFYAGCVPVEQCEPLACDPAYGGDGCPIDYMCDETSSTCRLPSDG
jgi:hypothetical protein